PPQPEPPPQPGPRTIIVSKAGGENTFPTLYNALAKANPGDRIVIAEPKLSEPALSLNRTQHKDVTLESGLPDGKPAVIEAAGSMKVLLEAMNAEGLHIRNLEFDGGGKAEVGIQLNGGCPGATVQNVTVRNMKGAGVRVNVAAGDPDRPILLDRV